jgi:hypothetical protein
VIQFDCVTLFPEMFAGVADYGITRRALEEGSRGARWKKDCGASRRGIRGISRPTTTARSMTGRTAAAPGW